jgi:hypothetical protein
MDGFPVITLPEGASTDEDDADSDAAKAATVVRNIRNDEQAGVVLPFGWTIDLLAPGAQSRLDADKVIRRYESRILMSALAQFLNLGQENVGSLALSSDQTDFFAMAINATADVISDAITKYALPRLMKLNGYDAEGLRLTHTPATKDDLAQLGTTLSQLAPFINITAEDEVWIRQMLRMPERAVEDIQADMDEKAAVKEAMQEAFMKKTDGKDGKPGEKPKPGETVEDEKGKKPAPFQKFAATAPDEAKRRRIEREFNKKLTEFMGKQKKRIIKKAREYRQ